MLEAVKEMQLVQWLEFTVIMMNSQHQEDSDNLQLQAAILEPKFQLKKWKGTSVDDTPSLMFGETSSILQSKLNPWQYVIPIL